MRKGIYRLRLQVAIFLLGSAFAGNYAAGQEVAEASSARQPASLQRFEVGIAYNNLGLNSCDQGTPTTVADCRPLPPHNSFGPGLTFNFNRHWSADTTYDITTGFEPLANNSYINGSVSGGRGSKALEDVRYNFRARKYSFFLYGKAGAVIWSDIFSRPVGPGGNIVGPVTYGTQAYLALGGGGGFEYSPLPRIHVRASVGELVVDYRLDRYSGCTICSGKATAWDGNSDATVGLYYGLGREIPRSTSPFSSDSAHKFFDNPNMALIGFDGLAQTADAIGTQHFIRNGFVEQDGLIRPLLDQGWPGQITEMALDATVDILVMYGLHRLGFHRLERFFALAAAGPNAYGAYLGLSNWNYFSGH